jgi:hypothetical protein
MLLHALVALTLLLTLLDHWTTYLCLRAPVDGWEVVEANPIADWLFQSVGLVPGILVDTAFTVMALAFLIGTRLVPNAAKGAFFALVISWTTWAVVNNLGAIEAMGLSPLGAF